MKLEVKYERNLHHNNLIVKALSEKVSGYQIQMLLNNNIAGFLKMDLRIINNTYEYCYDIRSKQALNIVLDTGKLDYYKMKTIFLEILNTVENSTEFLLTENDIVLVLDYIFIDLNSMDVFMCYVAGYDEDIKKQLCGLIEQIMNKMDHDDEKLILLVYGIYNLIRKDEVCLEQIYEFVYNESGMTKQEDTAETELLSESEERINNINVLERQRDEKDKLVKSNGKSKSGETEKYKNTLNHKSNKPINNNNRKEVPLIPMMEERIDSEEEIVLYPLSTKIFAAGSFLFLIIGLIFSIKSKVFFDSFGNRFDIIKFLVFLLIMIIGEILILYKLFNKNNMISKVIPKIEYINNNELNANNFSRNDPNNNKVDIQNKTKHPNPQSNSNSLGINEKMSINDAQMEKSSKNNSPPQQEYEKTCLLFELSNSGYYKLSAISTGYEDADLIEFPFLIGKKLNQNGLELRHNAVSWIHAKFELFEDELFLTDLNSTNGTYINKERLLPYESRKVKEFDELLFAHISYRIERIIG